MKWYSPRFPPPPTAQPLSLCFISRQSYRKSLYRKYVKLTLKQTKPPKKMLSSVLFFLSKHSIPVVLNWAGIRPYCQISDCTSRGQKNLNWRLACWSHNSTFGKENGMCNIFPSNGIKKKERKKETFVWQLWKQLSLSRGLKVKLKCRWCNLHKFVESLSYCPGTVWKAYLFLKYKRGYRESLIRTSRGHA